VVSAHLLGWCLHDHVVGFYRGKFCNAIHQTSGRSIVKIKGAEIQRRRDQGIAVISSLKTVVNE
jgi:hypothetical protein